MSEEDKDWCRRCVGWAINNLTAAWFANPLHSTLTSEDVARLYARLREPESNEATLDPVSGRGAV